MYYPISQRVAVRSDSVHTCVVSTHVSTTHQYGHQDECYNKDVSIPSEKFASNPQHSPQVCHTTSSGIRFSTGSPPELPHHCTLPFSQTENHLSVPKETRPLLQSKRRNSQSQAFLRFTDTT